MPENHVGVRQLNYTVPAELEEEYTQCLGRQRRAVAAAQEGNPARAVRLLRVNLNWCENHLSKDPIHPMTLWHLGEIGIRLISMKQFNEAIIYVGRAYDIWESLDPLGNDTLKILEHYAYALAGDGHLGLAAGQYEELWNAYRKVFGDEAEATLQKGWQAARSWFDAATASGQVEDPQFLKKARGIYEQVVAAWESKRAAGSLKAIRARADLAINQAMLDQFAAAETMLERCLADLAALKEETGNQAEIENVEQLCQTWLDTVQPLIQEEQKRLEEEAQKAAEAEKAGEGEINEPKWLEVGQEEEASRREQEQGEQRENERKGEDAREEDEANKEEKARREENSKQEEGKQGQAAGQDEETWEEKEARTQEGTGNEEEARKEAEVLSQEEASFLASSCFVPPYIQISRSFPEDSKREEDKPVEKAREAEEAGKEQEEAGKDEEAKKEEESRKEKEDIKQEETRKQENATPNVGRQEEEASTQDQPRQATHQEETEAEDKQGTVTDEAGATEPSSACTTKPHANQEFPKEPQKTPQSLPERPIELQRPAANGNGQASVSPRSLGSSLFELAENRLWQSQRRKNAYSDSWLSNGNDLRAPRERSASAGPVREEETDSKIEAPAAPTKPKPVADSKTASAKTAQQNGGDVDIWFAKVARINEVIFKPYRRQAGKRVKVGILDTGIDMKNVAFKDDAVRRRIKKRVDFLNDGGKEGAEDTCGHGTYCAALINRVAPAADIYVGRVATGFESGLDDEVVAKAISVALGSKDNGNTSNWDVDILSLSFGLQHYSKAIGTALRTLVGEDKIVLAAASNNGTLCSMAYPAWDPHVIAINSANSRGRPSDFNPPAVPGKTLTILGENVVSAWTTTTTTTVATTMTNPPASNGVASAGTAKATTTATTTTTAVDRAATRRMSGTSVATPIAAGVVALLQELAMLELPDEPGTQALLRDVLPYLKWHVGLSEVLTRRAVPTGDFLNIVPGNLLKLNRTVGQNATVIQDILEQKFSFERMMQDSEVV
ncbi:c907a9ff-a809-45c6-bf31-0e9f76e61be6 [Thermothielavioides terrestris]|uniref:C907a9ff-a809-45c6-bf31-0e9f76e61be6 n=1 Tax=Thermothielavioides terrestris TaxID=2587410 RepID=A0A446B5D8_9PEZI|nr:c907a9ff-a809-45c6-bf31-0e9f76e61be6 [Thermothielavioides terrestris]